MDALLIIPGVFLILIGLVGCVVLIIPGPPLGIIIRPFVGAVVGELRKTIF